MSNKSECKAKNPETCRYHGVSYIVEARKRLITAEKAIIQATTIAEVEKLKDEYEEALVAWDSTAKGYADLDSQIKRLNFSNPAIIPLRLRLIKAEQAKITVLKEENKVAKVKNSASTPKQIKTPKATKPQEYDLRAIAAKNLERKRRKQQRELDALNNLPRNIIYPLNDFNEDDDF